jgi:hypothetical protein
MDIRDEMWLCMWLVRFLIAPPSVVLEAVSLLVALE